MKAWPFNRGTAGSILPAAAAPYATRALSDVAQSLPAPDGAKTSLTYTEAFFNGEPLPGVSPPVANAYSASWIAYACIRRLAQDAAGVPMLFLSDPEDPESEVPADHPTRRLFERPGHYFSTREVVQWIVTFLNMRGEFFLPFDDPFRPKVIVPHTDPLHWRETTEGWDLLGWEYRNGPTLLRLLPEELIHHRLVDPARPFRGQTPLRAAAKAFGIEVGADTLTENIVARGGERAMLFTAEMDITRQQRDQAIAMLRSRRSGDGRVGRDTLLPNGVKPLDPRFIDDDMKVLDAAAAQPDKIAAVFGVPRSLLGFEDVDKFATFEGRKRMYYTDTLIPLLAGVEASFDRMFVETLPSAYACYVRWNFADVPAMQSDLGERFATAGLAHDKGLPWAVLNERFALGLADEKIPGADTVMVSSTLAPLDKLIEEWNTPAPPPSNSPAGGADEPGDPDAEGDGGKGPRLTNFIIAKRAGNVRELIRRGQRLLKLERDLAAGWRVEVNRTGNEARRLVKARADRLPETKDGWAALLRPAFRDLGERLAKVAGAAHEAAALEGERSVVELVEGKFTDSERDLWTKAHKWRPGTADVIRKRRNYTVPQIASDFFDDVVAACLSSVLDGAEVNEVYQVLASRMASAPGGLNRAATVARTEVGSAYNVARFEEMKGQGFKRHKWLTNGDELVRGNDPGDLFDHAKCHDKDVAIGDPFPCGLTYPMQDGGEAGNVINCRCESIPFLED